MGRNLTHETLRHCNNSISHRCPVSCAVYQNTNKGTKKLTLLVQFTYFLSEHPKIRITAKKDILKQKYP